MLEFLELEVANKLLELEDVNRLLQEEVEDRNVFDRCHVMAWISFVEFSALSLSS